MALRSPWIGVINVIGITIAALAARRMEVGAQPERVRLFARPEGCATSLDDALRTLRSYPDVRNRACPPVTIRCVDRHVAELVAGRRRFCTTTRFEDSPAGLADCLREARSSYLDEYTHYGEAQCRAPSHPRDASVARDVIDASMRQRDGSTTHDTPVPDAITTHDTPVPDVITTDVLPELARARSVEDSERPHTVSPSPWSLALGGAWRGWFSTDGGERADSWGGSLGVVYESGRHFMLATSLSLTRGAEDSPQERRTLTLVEVSAVPMWFFRRGALRLSVGAGARGGVALMAPELRDTTTGYQVGVLVSLGGAWSIAPRWGVQIGFETGVIVWSQSWSESGRNAVSVRTGSVWMTPTIGIERRF